MQRGWWRKAGKAVRKCMTSLALSIKTLCFSCAQQNFRAGSLSHGVLNLLGLRAFKLLGGPKSFCLCKLYLSTFAMIEIILSFKILTHFKIPNHKPITCYIMMLFIKITVFSKRKVRRVAWFYSFANFFNDCFNRRQLDSYVCLCTQTVLI